MTSPRILALLSVSILFGTATSPVPQATTQSAGSQAAVAGPTVLGDLRKFLQHMEVIEVDDGLGNMVTTIRFHGANVQIVSGSGTTDSAVDGTGNLIVGYNELRLAPAPNDRSGSHNLVVGKEHNFTSFGSFLTGHSNTASGNFSSVSGGINNTASGYFSSVSGGYYNTASGERSSVSGGNDNRASGTSSSVSGARNSTASGNWSSVSGGSNNTASGNRSSVSGGSGRTAAGTNDWRAGSLFEDN